MTKLRLPNGNIVTNSKDILECQKTFYENLYKSNEPNLNSKDSKYFLQSLQVPKLTKQKHDHCERVITVEDCENILKTFKDNKSLGNDGLTI